MFRKDPDRQSRRNRLPHHPHGAQDGRAHRCRLFRRRRKRAACRDGRRGGAYRRGAGRRKLSARRRDHRGGACDRRRGDPSRATASCRKTPISSTQVVAAGLVFIGPSAASIRAMGLKDAAKRLMEKAGVPVVPGYHGEAQEFVLLAAKPSEIGYPVLIKARAGGGGKGMRRVDHPRRFRRGAGRRAARGQGRLRRRPRAGREICRQAAPYRGAGVRRQLRQCRASLRARLLGAAPPPEGDRGGAGARHDRRDARGDDATPP